MLYLSSVIGMCEIGFCVQLVFKVGFCCINETSMLVVDCLICYCRSFIYYLSILVVTSVNGILSVELVFKIWFCCILETSMLKKHTTNYGIASCFFNYYSIRVALSLLVVLTFIWTLRLPLDTCGFQIKGFSVRF